MSEKSVVVSFWFCFLVGYSMRVTLRPTTPSWPEQKLKIGFVGRTVYIYINKGKLGSLL